MIRALRLALPLACAAGPVLAHGTLPGGGGFYDGLLHPVWAVEHLVALVALGLLLGREGMRAPLLVLAAAAALGLAVPAAVPLAPTLPVIAGAALAGAALALPFTLPGVAAAALAALLGLAVGADSEAPTPLAVAGLGTGIALVTLNAMALAGPLARPATGIALRVAGSWIAAFAMLLTALAVTAGRP
jgi:urease accessory protein